ncbi:MAG: sigma-70 family RNA polymerase sigma factor, partial [Opitutaceae bacterium]
MIADDAELLQRYAANRDEAAFAELVGRYLNLVYFAALRQVAGDAHRAEDVAQQVFTRLARQASALSGHPTLAGWLHTTSRMAASEIMRTERRRLAREQEAHTMHELFPGSDPAVHADWDKLRPVIDAALGELNEADREAVLLRFFAGLPLAQIGARLNVSENTAR